ncbi:hypothetical protein B9P84_00435 [Citrobacter braakii]|nr:hypothetical protein B9P84_00435 [Citrobacter braakii]
MNVKNLLFYCLFLRGAPHHLGAKISCCTFQVLPALNVGATRLHIQPKLHLSCRTKQYTCQNGEREMFCGPDKRNVIRPGKEGYLRRWRRLITTAPKPNSAVSSQSGQLPVRA